MVIGKIPGYNSAIIGNQNINYQGRLLNNLTITNFTPIGYSMDFFSSKSLYRLGSDLQLDKDLQNNTLSNPTFNDASQYGLNAVNTFNALKQWKQMQSSIGLKDQNIIESFKIVATNDSTIMETLSNQYTDNQIDQMANKFANSQILSMLGTGFTKVLPSLDSSAALSILGSINNSIDQSSSDGKSLNDSIGQATKALVGRMIGIQSAFPRIWDRSSYNNTSSLTIKLVSPSGHPNDIMKYVIDPLRYLILAASPVTFDGITYGFPPLWKVEAKGMLSMKLAGISALSISRGGPDTIFNYQNMPTNIDVRMVVEPVVAGFATPMYADLTDDIDENGYVDMIVQNPNAIIKPMSNKAEQDSSIELKSLILY